MVTFVLEKSFAIFTVIYTTDEPEQAIEKDSVHVQQTVLNVNRHLHNTHPFTTNVLCSLTR